MNTPHTRRGRPALVLVTSAFAFSAALGWMVPAGASTPTVKYSDADCEVVTTGDSNFDQGTSGNSEQENLADQADGFEAAADDVSNKKLKKGLLLMADVYSEASKAKNVAGAGAVIAKRSKDWAKGYKIYAKALNQCILRSIPRP